MHIETRNIINGNNWQIPNYPTMSYTTDEKYIYLYIKAMNSITGSFTIKLDLCVETIQRGFDVNCYTISTPADLIWDSKIDVIYTDADNISSAIQNYAGFVKVNTTLGMIRIHNGTNFIEYDGEVENILRNGTTSNRPKPTKIGFQYYDTKIVHCI